MFDKYLDLHLKKEETKKQQDGVDEIRIMNDKNVCVSNIDSPSYGIVNKDIGSKQDVIYIDNDDGDKDNDKDSKSVMLKRRGRNRNVSVNSSYTGINYEIMIKDIDRFGNNANNWSMNHNSS